MYNHQQWLKNNDIPQWRLYEKDPKHQCESIEKKNEMDNEMQLFKDINGKRRCFAK